MKNKKFKIVKCNNDIYIKPYVTDIDRWYIVSKGEVLGKPLSLKKAKIVSEWLNDVVAYAQSSKA